MTCDRPADQRFFLPEPRLIVEVLLRSTAAHDRGRKGEEYRHIADVETILFVFSDERRVELWRREGERWVIEDPSAKRPCASMASASICRSRRSTPASLSIDRRPPPPAPR